MKKFLLGLLLAGSSFAFYDEVYASEVSDTEVQSVEQEEVETIYFSGNQGLLITDDVIIRKISDLPSNDIPNLESKFNYNGNGVVTLGAGEWDLIGDEFVKQTSGIYPSHGGDYRVSLVQSKFGPYLYALREDDGAIYQTVKNFNFSEEGVFEMIFRDISSYCDGSDGLAEFYIYKSTMTSTADYISFWD
ncbi:hypothetical protein ACIQXG_20450 [Lysinibacillus sphaericus]|uniref:hypothetical protein n=1 Tax=Lysinibacillus sphaericus TaxID=1421 RepID=UPI0037F3CE39